MRYMLAWDHALCRAVDGRLRAGGARLPAAPRAPHGAHAAGAAGAVAIIQRFGAALNLNVHVHALVLDGVYVEDERGTLRFHEAVPPANEEMERVLGTIERRIKRLLTRRGVLDDVGEGGAADPWREEAPALAGIAEASVQGRRALGERAGAGGTGSGGSAELLALAPSRLEPCHAQRNGFNLHAGRS